MSADEDDVPVFPLLGYGTGAADGAVVVSLEMATSPGQYHSRAGVWVSTALTPEHAMDLGRELIAVAERAALGATVN